MKLHESTLTKNVDMLGRMLGNIVRIGEGNDLFEKIEKIRKLAKSARKMNDDERGALLDMLSALDDDDILPIVKAFSHFLNLANIADDHFGVSQYSADQSASTTVLDNLFAALDKGGVEDTLIQQALKNLSIELVLTAHPTEITRRTLIYKYSEIDHSLGRLELSGISPAEKARLQNRVEELIAQIWHSDTFRHEKPTPIDEAKWCMAVVESSLWQAVPAFCRELDAVLKHSKQGELALTACPVSFVSWIGGDRDGNPNVTASITREVLQIHRWKLAELYLQDIKDLISELSMASAPKGFRDYAGTEHEPYRQVLRQLRALLQNTYDQADAIIKGEAFTKKETLCHIDQIAEPLLQCYHALVESNLSLIANAKLLDTIKRVFCFGTHLLKLDIRQESGRHAACLSEITQFLELGDYALWAETDKQGFLIRELNNKRPLIPLGAELSADTQEVLDTCRVLAETESEAFGAYVISMAKAPSDILAVQLLLKVAGFTQKILIAPLFETLDDLNHAASVIESLLEIKNLPKHTLQMVMIGYSDSAKDAGVFASGWAQYQAQEALLACCEKKHIDLILFHGRGGTIGRGGDPAHSALLSQPPGSLKSGLRVTVQGEMIRNKLGLPLIAQKTLALYTSAVMTANLQSPPHPKPAWRAAVDKIAQQSCEAYRGVVRQTPAFLEYFREATPINELSDLPLGSRPTRRKQDGGIENLRAIPWIFAWSQNRLMLPAWLGFGEALQSMINEGEMAVLEDMCKHWPFFSTRISMLEMVFAKADAVLSAYYDKCLVQDKLLPVGEGLRAQLSADITTVLSLTHDSELMEDAPESLRSFSLRNPYVDPLNLIQAELLRRYRGSQDENLRAAIMVSIAGIAAGLRNTG